MESQQLTNENMIIEINDKTVSFTHLAERLHDTVTSLVLNKVKITGDDDALYDFWRVLRGHPALRELSWSNVTFEDPDADVGRLLGVAFVSCHKLTSVKLNGMHVPADAFKSAEYSANLREICLSNDHYTDEEATTIAEALARNPNIQEIDFRGNDITEQGQKSFEARLSVNKSIRHITLDNLGAISKDKFRRQNSASAA